MTEHDSKLECLRMAINSDNCGSASAVIERAKEYYNYITQSKAKKSRGTHDDVYFPHPSHEDEEDR